MIDALYGFQFEHDAPFPTEYEGTLTGPTNDETELPKIKIELLVGFKDTEPVELIYENPHVRVYKRGEGFFCIRA